MKKTIAMLLTLVCLLTLPGCRRAGQDASSGKKEPMTAEQMEEKLEMTTLRVLMDLQKSGVDSGQLTEALAGLPGYGTDFTIYVDFVPDGGADRSSMMTQIKTEILAGKGPDLFLCDQNMSAVTGVSYRVGGDTPTVEPFFTFPEKAMKNHLFLPLDEYIEKAEYMEWDKLLPVVMEAGRNEEGQQILPMTFTFKVNGVNTEYYTMDADMPMTWEESLVCDDKWVRYNAGLGSLSDNFGDYISLEDDTMRISEEDIVDWYRKREGVNLAARRGEFPEFTEYSENYGYHVFKGISDEKFGIYMDIGTFSLKDSHDPLGGEENYWLAPAYNTDGGITATIDTFTAINRNTEHPGLSFRVLDYLLAYNTQRGPLYTNLYGMPVHMDVGTDGSRGPGWSMNEWNRDQYLGLRDQINAARFRTPVDSELEEIFADYEAAGDLEGSVHKHYVTALMMLAES